MNSTSRTILIAAATALVVAVIGGFALWWFSPMRSLSTSGWDPGMWDTGRGSGPGMGMGRMGRGMMDQMHAMADVESEYEFLANMIPHHMAAVMMSQQLLAGGLAEHDEVEELAGTIRDAQMREIRQMSRWLREWN